MRNSLAALVFLSIFSSFSFSFAAECSLPAPQIHVKADFPHPILDRSLSSYDLNQATNTRNSDIMTRGLTVTNTVVRRQAELVMEKAADDTSWCVSAKSINISVTMNEPTRVYIASDIIPGSCTDRTTIAHEQQHVTFAFDAQTEMARSIGNELGQRLASFLPFRSTSPEDAKMQMDGLLSQILDEIIKPAQDEQAALNASIDTPENYARVAAMCR